MKCNLDRRPSFAKVSCVVLGVVTVQTALLIGSASARESAAASEAELAQAKGWAAARFVQPRPDVPGVSLPFSFVYDGKKSDTLLNSWKSEVVTTQTARGVQETTITCTDPATGLQVRCVASEFPGFSAVEWIVYFKNTSDKDTPIISDIRAIDSGIGLTRDKPAVLHYALGSECRIDDFAPQLARLGPSPNAPQGPWVGEGNPVRLQSREGRSSCGTMPFFNVDGGAQGVVCAIGWTGDWAANVYRTDSEVRMQAGMPRTHLKLLPGEEIRSPRIAMVFWNGERLRGHNLLRRFIMAHHSPLKETGPIRVPVSLATWGGNFAKNHIEHGKWWKDHDLPLDFLWVDAGWFGKDEAKIGANVFNSNWGALVGDWFPNPGYFPEGLGPVGKALKDCGIGFLLWLEPERVFQGTAWTREHPEYLLGPAGPNYLFNLGNPAARQALTDHLVNLLNDGNISCYRQDFNFDPRPFWDAADAPDRVGITEIKHITGLYQMWDDVIARCPGLLIDNCASGGRRIDLESISRSVPLWRSDFQCFPGYNPAAMQTQTHGLNLWTPLSAGACDREDTYLFRSAMGPGLDLIMYEFEKDSTKHFSIDWLRKMLGELNQVRSLFLGDFYPLADFSVSDDAWAAWQFDRPDLKSGAVFAFRRAQSPFVEATLMLKGLEPGAKYEFRDIDTGTVVQLSGEECMSKGLRVEIPNKPAATVLLYKML